MAAEFINSDGAKIHLVSLGQKDDGDINLIEAGFAFALLDAPKIKIKKYREYIETLSRDLKTEFDNLCATMNGDGAMVQAQALKNTMAQSHAYIGDEKNYDDLKNINLFDVIDRRMGMPITLCVIAIEICRTQGWQADGVNFPGHFLMRLEKDGERLIIDPFQGCEILEAKDMRLILKNIMGDDAELSANYYDPCTNREILLRLQNNIKYRLIDAENYDDALGIVDTMTWVAPDDYRLCLDKAVLMARLDQTKGAIDNIKIYLNHVSDPIDKSEAEAFLYQLQSQLN